MKPAKPVLGATFTVLTTTKLAYLDIPALGTFRLGSGNTKFVLQAGPYVGFAIGGSIQAEVQGGIGGLGSIGIGGESEAISFGNDPDENDLRRLDFGLIGGAGIEFGAFRIGAQYNLGLANISAFTDNGTTVRNRVLSFHVGYFFGR
ncbi:MAG: PorT family protein [Saprospiraceae bacterium]|nr:PorT family protein [Saprospiraceae bacterium]